MNPKVMIKNTSTLQALHTLEKVTWSWSRESWWTTSLKTPIAWPYNLFSKNPTIIAFQETRSRCDISSNTFSTKNIQQHLAYMSRNTVQHMSSNAVATNVSVRNPSLKIKECICWLWMRIIWYGHKRVKWLIKAIGLGKCLCFAWGWNELRLGRVYWEERVGWWVCASKNVVGEKGCWGELLEFFNWVSIKNKMLYTTQVLTMER